MSLFDTTFRKQVFDYLPPVLRNSELVDYLYSLLIPIESRLIDDTAFEAENRDETRYNGQKIVLQAGINEIMGVTIAPFIIIVPRKTFLGIAPLILNESEVDETARIVNETESEETMLIINNSEETVFDEDFVVEIPASLSTSAFDERVDAKITRMKAIGLTHRIEIV